MNEKERDAIKRHVAGAIMVHNGPFSDLTTPENKEDLSHNFLKKFVAPFYMNLKRLESRNDELENHIKKILPEINSDTVDKLLGDFNWRTRSVGAFFAALKNLTDFHDRIGKLMLKSEVSYAGTTYCLTLSEFNNQKSIDYLNQYLDYYLTQKDLWFDQSYAMGALAYLDNVNGTKELNKHLEKWRDFVSNKNNWDLEKSIEHFEKNMNGLKEIKKYAI